MPKPMKSGSETRWTRSNLNFTPSRNFSGSISSMTGVIDPKPVLPDNVVISDGPGVINISWDANNNEEHEFIIDPVTTAESRHIAEEGENEYFYYGFSSRHITYH